MSECLKFAENQMANTFFGFNTTLNDHAERLGSSPEDIEGLEAEEEYDALNDETFGALENEGDLDDWEAQHEQLAEIAESSRHSNDMESFLERIGLNDDESVAAKVANVWSYIPFKNGDKVNTSSPLDSSAKLLAGIPPNDVTSPLTLPYTPHTAPKLRTVEELERMLINQAKPSPQHAGPRYPPGFQPLLLGAGPPGGPWPPPGAGAPPAGMVRVPHGGRGPPPGFVGYTQQHGQGFAMPPHFSFPPPPRLTSLPPGLLPRHPHPKPPYPSNHTPHPHHRPPHQPHPVPHPHHHPLHPPPPHPHHQQLHPHHQHHVQQQHHHSNNNHYQQQQQQHGGGGGGDTRDEYAGLMNNREKQWLLNIQLLQVNTGTPYFDDYYYTVFKERQAKNKDSGDQRMNQRYHNRGNVRDGNAGHHHHQAQHQEQQNPVKKTYTPLQFENSLGKLQFGSVTAPRKIIDMDIISTSEPEPQVSSRDSRKTKQLLLELEALYSLLLRAEDLRNPLAVASQEKLLELRQKQRLREMDAAPTPEQKQEVLRLLQKESQAPLDTPQDLLSRLLTSLLEAGPAGPTGGGDRLASLLAVRKGRLLVLRALPQLALHPALRPALRELWARVLLALPAVGRRDSTGDNVLVRLTPHLKKFLNTAEMEEILELVVNLTEIMKLENSRSTPLSHQSKAPLHFILQNKFGISALSLILQRVDSLWTGCTEKQQSDWSSFLTAVVDTLSLVGSVTSPPLEPISDACLTRHVDRLGGLTADKKQLLQKVFLDSVQ